jgi:carbamoyltransferase
LAHAHVLSLGLSLGPRAGAAVLLRNQRVVAAAMEQRRAGRTPTLPIQAVEFCLHQAGLADLTGVQVLGLQSRYATDWADFFAGQFSAEKGWFESLLTFPANLRQELNFRTELRQELANLTRHSSSLPELTLVADELALAQGLYATSASYPTAILVLDVPFAQMASGLWLARGNGPLEQVWLQDFPQSLELFVHNFASFCGFRGRMGQRQFLQLAEYGENRFIDLVEQDLFKIEDNGRFQLNTDLLVNEPHDEADWSALRRLLNADPRKSTQPISSREIDLAHALVHVVQKWAAKLNQDVIPALGCKQMMVRASGPLTEKVRMSWRKSNPALDFKFSLSADEPLLMAAGAALEALSTEGFYPERGFPLELRPEPAFRQYTRPTPMPLGLI